MYLRGALPPTTGYLLYLYFLSGAEQSKRCASMYLWTLHYIICLCRPTLTSLSLGPPTMTISFSLWHTCALVSQLFTYIFTRTKVLSHFTKYQYGPLPRLNFLLQKGLKKLVQPRRKGFLHSALIPLFLR